MVEKLFAELEFRTLGARLKNLLSNLSSDSRGTRDEGLGNSEEETSQGPTLPSLAVEEKAPQELRIALWLLNSEITNPTTTDILQFSGAKDLAGLVSQLKGKRIIWLIKTILSNYQADKEGRGMPLGNLTSQFFANVFLNELDQFVKHKLRAKYYIRYVNDFVILDRSPKLLHQHMKKVDVFLQDILDLELHPDKSKIIPLSVGVEFLGMKIFSYHRLLKGKKLRKFYRKLNSFYSEYDQKKTNYDAIYDFLVGWSAYAKNANTYGLRKRIMGGVENKFSKEISSKEINRLSRRSRRLPRPGC